ncbi:flagellar hook-basal body complex protein FliE [Telmatospirillum sp.]|uniref:flagellar hook-basal body complex protein FliE n=1 Tax=Telmatospirillum sp. TaxID=2079197 RepID=UPI002846525D|nr:flagellar hook-basal body complex protein FliE [Telmatospirillum sp.]MDR3438516.1 flagellar hook-basal body complex protein FliE [Telmatospirillum sp.]
MAISSITDAIAAYNNAAKSISGESSSSAADESQAPGSDFASLLQNGVKAAIDASKKSEELSKQGLAGKADVRDVVAAVNNAEVTLQTVVAVRDKVISAYSEILHMAI